MRTVLFLLVLAGVVAAKDVEVTPATLESALAAGGDGDTIGLGKGRYARPAVLTKGVALLGGDGVVFDPTERFEAKWEATEDKGVYRTTVAKRPYGLLVEGKFLAELNERRA